MDLTWILNLFKYFKSCISSKRKKSATNNIEIKNSTVILIGDIRKLTK